jgi:hypothetical protein
VWWCVAGGVQACGTAPPGSGDVCGRVPSNSRTAHSAMALLLNAALSQSRTALRGVRHASFFAHVQPAPKDPILGISENFKVRFRQACAVERLAMWARGPRNVYANWQHNPACHIAAG